MSVTPVAKNSAFLKGKQNESIQSNQGCLFFTGNCVFYYFLLGGAAVTEAEIKLNLLIRAIERHDRIQPCGMEPSLLDCFKYENGKWYFWYNIGEATYMEKE